MMDVRDIAAERVRTLVTPISAAGFCVATGGAFVILFFYKLLGGYYFREGDGHLRTYRRRRSVRAPAALVIDEE